MLNKKSERKISVFPKNSCTPPFLRKKGIDTIKIGCLFLDHLSWGNFNESA